MSFLNPFVHLLYAFNHMPVIVKIRSPRAIMPIIVAVRRMRLAIVLIIDGRA
jgi:hypothetical protein